MSPSLNILALAALLLPAAALAQSDDTGPVYSDGQYTAELHQGNHKWRLLPFNGPDQEIDASGCAMQAPIPDGLWLVVTDSDGQPVLLAPSTTPLPAGANDRIALRACESSEPSPALAAPQALIDLLVANTGAIYVND